MKRSEQHTKKIPFPLQAPERRSPLYMVPSAQRTTPIAFSSDDSCPSCTPTTQDIQAQAIKKC